MLEKMKEIIASQLNVSEGEVTESASFKDDLGADSLDLFELVMALEEEYSGEESAQIARLLEKRKFVAEEADEREFQRTYQYLLRRGFRSSDILKVMKAKPEF